MIKNYLKIAFRNLKKDKQFTFLNVIGLSAGIACTLLIYLWVHDELRFDKEFDNDNQIYQVMEHRKNAGSQSLTDESSGLVSDVLKLQHSQVMYAAAVAPPDWFQKSTLTVGDKSLRASGQYAGKDYFDIFSFKMLVGDRSKVLNDKTSIVISSDLAQRLFNSTNVLGRGIKVQNDKVFFVSGVYQMPVHSSQQFDFVQSFDYLADMPGQSWVKTWGNGGPHNFIMLKNGTDVDAFNKSIAKLISRNTADTARSLFAMRFSDNYLENTFNHGSRVGGRGEYVKLFSIIAIFILVIACINFMNLSTAKAAGRMKEVGVKKVVGAHRSHLILQFLSESLMLASFTTLIALGIVWLLLPEFNELTAKDIHLDFSFQLLSILIIITLVTGLLSGSYPALYLSRFQPLAILKGKLKTSLGELIARKGLVVFQFTLSVVLIVSVLIVYQQIQFIKSTDPGYNKDNIIRFNSEGALMGHEDDFVNALKNIPGVVNAGFTQHNMVGRNFGTASVSWDGDNTQTTYFEGFFGSYNFIETMGMHMAAGRPFEKNFGDETNKVVLNEAAIRAMHLKDPVGKNIKIGGGSLQIIGVVKDFHYESLHETVTPSFIVLATSGGNPWYKLMVRIKGGDQKGTIAAVQHLYESFNPGFPFAYNFLDDAYQKQYETETRISVLSKYFSGLAIIISCLGLFGLVAFTAQTRQKEIGIRKVIGASVQGLAVMLTSDFLKLVGIAVLIAFPLSWWMMSQWLNGFAYRITISPAVFIVALLSVIVITILTVGFQAIKAALANPVKSLRSE